MYVLLWLNTMAAVQIFFMENIFIFFMTLFFKKMGIILTANNPRSHSRLKTLLKILAIFGENILGKQLS